MVPVFDESRLSAAFAGSARFSADDLPIRAFLGQLVERIVEVLPVSGAGVTWILPGSEPHYLVATDDWARHVEQLQTELGQGPSRLAYESDTHVAVPQLGADERFPQFGPAAVAAGLAAVFSFPLRSGEDERLGALDLFRDSPGALERRDLITAQTLAEMTSAYLANVRACQVDDEASRPFRRIGDHRRDARRADERNRLRHDLGNALARHELELAYQPIVRTTDRQITAVEALLRWTDPQGQPVPADTTIELAEQSGLITRIGAWVLERACRDRGRWLNRNDTALEVAVNVSTRQLMQPGFAAHVAAILESTAMDPAALVLEMTEGIFIDDAARAMTVLEDLKTLGVRLALDDFGTGYSSLAYLRQFPVDIVKIDQQFIADLGQKTAGMAIIDAVTNLAHVLDLSVTAEGIETAAQHEQIARIGCEHAQGFHYARPMPSPQLVAQLTSGHGFQDSG